MAPPPVAPALFAPAVAGAGSGKLPMTITEDYHPSAVVRFSYTPLLNRLRPRSQHRQAAGCEVTPAHPFARRAELLSTDARHGRGQTADLRRIDNSNRPVVPVPAESFPDGRI